MKCDTDLIFIECWCHFAYCVLFCHIVTMPGLPYMFPSCYKEALVTPLLKKQSLDCNLLHNYRPVSNLTLISKTIEKVVSAQLNTYLKDNNLLEPCQSAYRQGHSTETALVRVQNDVICAVGQRKAVLLVLLDLSAAFDTVNHQLLIKTLQQLGIRGTMLHWFSTYLVGRLQRIKVNGVTSQPKLLECGVPQGSVLGPILFTIYTASGATTSPAWCPISLLCRRQSTVGDLQTSRTWYCYRTNGEMHSISAEMDAITSTKDEWWQNGVLGHLIKINRTRHRITFAPYRWSSSIRYVQRHEHRCDDGLQSINGGPRGISLQVVLYPHSQPE